MIIGKIVQFHWFGIKTILIVLIVLFFFTMYYCSPNKLHKQLQGNSFLVFDSLSIYRTTHIYFIDYNIQIKGQKITLPPIISN